MQKYTQSRRHFRSGARIGTIIVTVLILVIVFGAGFFVSKLTVGGGLTSKDDFQNQLQQQIRNEVKNAVTYSGRLSRNNGASSDYTTLSIISQNLHCVEILNDILITCYGERNRIFTTEELSQASDVADEFVDKLQSGSRIVDSVDELTEVLETLYQKTTQTSHGSGD